MASGIIDANIVGQVTNGDDARHAGIQLIERDAVHMGMEPEQTRRVIGWDRNEVVSVVEIHTRVAQMSQTGSVDRSVGRVECQHKDVVTVRVGSSGGELRCDNETVSVHVDWIQSEESLSRLILMLASGQRELVNKAELESTMIS